MELSPATIRSSVDLPQPERPTNVDELVLADREVDVVEGDDREALAGLERLRNPLDLDQRPVRYGAAFRAGTATVV